MRKCINCGREDGSWIVRIRFVDNHGFGYSENRPKFVCSKKCLEALPKTLGLKFKIIKYHGEVK